MVNVSTALVAPARGLGILRLVPVILLALGSVGCGSGGVWVYLDNAGEGPMVVSVDGKEEITVAPDDCQKIVCQPGERHFKVRCGDKVLFEGTKDLPVSDSI